MNSIFDGPDNHGRRIFIKGLGALSVGFATATLLGGCESLREQIRNRPIRRRLRTGNSDVDNDIAIYREAVEIMKGLPNSDPRSWFAQAAIHGTAGVGFNFCHHGTNHFFSWHRAYLVFFEQICRELTGEKDFGLPYWNWNQNVNVHSAFLDNSSALFESRTNTSVSGVSNFTDATLNPIFEDSNFFTFGSQIEGTPHNRGHTHIGDIMGGFGSAFDPLFWMHHCMVDYCWAKWNIELENDNPDDSTWNSASWDHFVDRNGNAVSTTAGLTTIMPLLSYQYECSRIGRFGCPLDITAISQEELKRIVKRVKKGTAVRFEIKKRLPISKGRKLLTNIPELLSTRVTAGDFAQIVDVDSAKERVFLSINYAQFPEFNDFYVRAFLNLPGANENTPIDSDHYAGSFSFFGTKGGHDGHGQHSDAPSFLINVTEVLKKLKRKGKIRSGDSLSVNLIALPEGKQMRKVRQELELQQIEFIVSPLFIKQR